MTTRPELRANLAALDDADLQAQCLAAIRRYKLYRSDKDALLVVDDCWGECQRRDRRDLWDAAIEAWKAERKENHAANVAATAEVYAKFDAQRAPLPEAAERVLREYREQEGV
jgi:hypothetical protein